MGTNSGDAESSSINIAAMRAAEAALAGLRYSLVPDIGRESYRQSLENQIVEAEYSAEEETRKKESERADAELVMNFREAQARKLSAEDNRMFNSFIEKKVFGAKDVDDLEGFLQRNSNKLDISQKVQLSSPLLFRSTTEAQKNIKWDGETGDICTKSLNLLGGVKALCEEKNRSKVVEWLSNDVTVEWNKIEKSKREALAQAFKEGDHEKALAIASTLPKELQEKICKYAQENNRELILWNNPELMKKTFDNIREEIRKDPQILANNPHILKKLDKLEKELSSPENKSSDREKAEALKEFAEENNLKIDQIKLKQDAVECTNNRAEALRNKKEKSAQHSEKDSLKSEDKVADLAEKLRDKVAMESGGQPSSKPGDIPRQRTAQNQAISPT